MSWKKGGPQFRGRAWYDETSGRPDVPKRYRVNARCFFRKDHTCDKTFGASKSCFVASPSDGESEGVVDLIVEKLARLRIDAMVAVREKSYGQDIVCTKICGKIIESQFCVVILDDTISDGTSIPNPNVYYEYGLMTALGKHIVPLQKEGLELAFNIQGYDTIKYTARSLSTELDRALRDAVQAPDEAEQESAASTRAERFILRRLELAGLTLADESWPLRDTIGDTPFRGFRGAGGAESVLVAKVDEQSDVETLLDDLPVVLLRVQRKAGWLKSSLAEREAELEALQKEHDEDAKEFGHRRLPKSYELTKAEESVARLRGLLKPCETVLLAFIIDPRVQRDRLELEVKAMLEDHQQVKAFWEEDGVLSIGPAMVDLSDGLRDGALD